MSESAIRILVVSHGHPSQSLGGAEVASHNLHKGLNELDDVSSFYLARVGPPVPRHSASALMSLGHKENELLYYANDFNHFFLSNHNTDEVRQDLLRFVRELEPDIVHFHHVLGLGLETLYAVREALPEAAIVMTFHEFVPICAHDGQMVKTGNRRLCHAASPIDCNGCFPDIAPARFLRRERFVKAMLALADHYVVPSAFLAGRYAEWGIDPDRITVIENGLDVAEEAPARTLTGPRPRRSRFAFFGQLTPYKGVDVLLDAITRVPEEIWGEDARLMIFGSNLERQPEAYRKTVEELIERAGPRVRFYGAYQNAEMPHLMQSVDWVVMPSIWWENSPVVIQEAFFHRRPLISSNIGGMAEKIADRVNGLHFRVFSAEDLADRLVEALTEEGLWDRLRDGIPEPCSYRACARRHLDLYLDVLEKRQPAGEPASPDTVAQTA